MRSHSASGERRLQGVVHGRKWSSHSPFMCKEKKMCVCMYILYPVCVKNNPFLCSVMLYCLEKEMCNIIMKACCLLVFTPSNTTWLASVCH